MYIIVYIYIYMYIYIYICGEMINKIHVPKHQPGLMKASFALD